jgi:hypothetical protein
LKNVKPRHEAHAASAFDAMLAAPQTNLCGFEQRLAMVCHYRGLWEKQRCSSSRQPDAAERTVRSLLAATLFEAPPRTWV